MKDFCIFEVKRLVSGAYFRFFLVVIIVLAFLTGSYFTWKNDQYVKAYYFQLNKEIQLNHNDVEMMRHQIGVLSSDEQEPYIEKHIQELEEKIEKYTKLTNYDREIYRNFRRRQERFPYEVKRSESIEEMIRKSWSRPSFFRISSKDFEDQVIDMTEMKEAYALAMSLPSGPYEPSAQNLIKRTSEFPFPLLWILPLLMLMTISITRDFEVGTHKIIYSTPLTRSKIYLSKVMVNYTVGLFFFLLYLLLVVFSCGLLYSFGDFSYPVVFGEGITSTLVYLGYYGLATASTLLMLSALTGLICYLIKEFDTVLMTIASLLFVYLVLLLNRSSALHSPLNIASGFNYLNFYRDGTTKKLAINLAAHIVLTIAPVIIGLMKLSKEDLS